MEDKPRTDLGQADDKKDLRRAAYRGKVQFYRVFFVIVLDVHKYWNKLLPYNLLNFWYMLLFSCITIASHTNHF